MAFIYATRHSKTQMDTETRPSVEEAPVIVLMVPFPAYSHMNQLLQLSCLISSYNIPVHYAGSSIHNSLVKNRAYDLDYSQIQFHDFEIPPFVPDPASNSKEYLLPYFHVTWHLLLPVGKLIVELASKAKRIIIIHDALTSSAVQHATSITAKAETYVFEPATAFAVLCFLCAEKEKTLPVPSQLELEFKDKIEIPSVEGAFGDETSKFITRQGKFMRSSSPSGYLYSACKVIDGGFLDLVAKKENYKKVWVVGPLHQFTYPKNGRNSIKSRYECLEWLDKQERNSVLYICFGSMISMADLDQQLEKLADGLEKSEAKFIWVFTEPHNKKEGVDEGKKGHELLQGFEERTKGKGMMVRDWAPQLEILRHQSTGGFLSHCGWNSCVESISCGVPIATWPMHSDQPMNALLITDVLKIGVTVKEWARRDEVVSAEKISAAVKTLMDEGHEIRTRAKDLAAKVQSATAQEGVSRLECNSFIAHITRQT